MVCETVRLPGGGVAIVCSQRRRRPRFAGDLAPVYADGSLPDRLVGPLLDRGHLGQPTAPGSPRAPSTARPDGNWHNLFVSWDMSAHARSSGGLTSVASAG